MNTQLISGRANNPLHHQGLTTLDWPTLLPTLIGRDYNGKTITDVRVIDPSSRGGFAEVYLDGGAKPQFRLNLFDISVTAVLFHPVKGFFVQYESKMVPHLLNLAGFQIGGPNGEIATTASGYKKPGEQILSGLQRELRKEGQQYVVETIRFVGLGLVAPNNAAKVDVLCFAEVHEGPEHTEAPEKTIKEWRWYTPMAYLELLLSNGIVHMPVQAAAGMSLLSALLLGLGRKQMEEGLSAGLASMMASESFLPVAQSSLGVNTPLPEPQETKLRLN